LDFCPFGGIKVLGLKTNKKVKKNGVIDKFQAVK
jgi:hypothetical protein